MLLLELLSRLQNSNTSLLFWNLFTGLKFLNELNIKSSLSHNSHYHSAFVSIYLVSIQPPHGHNTRSSPYVTLIKPSSSLKVTRHLWNQLQNSSSESFISLSATFIWTCRFNLLHAAITFHHFFTLSSKPTFSENLIFHLSLLLSVGLISWL